jgi:hypothetical protein
VGAITDDSACRYALVVTRQGKVQRQDPIGCSEQEAVKNSLGAKPTLQAESLIARELFEALLAGQHVSTLFCHGSGVFWIDSLKRHFDVTSLPACKTALRPEGGLKRESSAFPISNCKFKLQRP